MSSRQLKYTYEESEVLKPQFKCYQLAWLRIGSVGPQYNSPSNVDYTLPIKHLFNLQLWGSEHHALSCTLFSCESWEDQFIGETKC